MRQDHRNLSLGKVEKITQDKQKFYIETPEARIQINIFTDEIIQVRAIRAHQEFEDFSYSVIAEPQEVALSFEDLEDRAYIKTPKIILEFTKEPFRVKFMSQDGTLLSEDEPSFGISWMGDEVTNYKKLQEGERFVGLGAKTGGLDRRGKYFRNWNSDVFAYSPDADPLYTSVPFYMGLLNQKVYGLFLDNTYETEFNFGASNNRYYYYQASAGEMRYYFIHDASVAKVMESYTHLTGRIQLPPIWSIGFQQCRYSYYPDTEVMNVADTFRTKDIPADVIYLDIHYMDAYKVFTFHPERFSDPKGLIQKLRDQGFHVVPMFDPGVKVEEGYTQYEEGKEKDYFLKFPDGELYTGEVWPGPCHFPDFTKAEVREWWGECYKEVVEMGIEGFWNDMNEPAVWDHKFPDLVEFDYDGLGASHKKSHNIYALNMLRSTYEGTRKLMKGKRPFTLTRAAFAGVQRYGAVWTGDNVSYDDHMLSDVRIINSLGLSGVAFAGCDVGGFAGESSVALFNRWIAIGAFAPFYRCHTMVNSRDAEPWAFGEETEEISRNYIKLRYRMLPYLYSAFYEASQTGMPVTRSLLIDYTFDDTVFAEPYQNQYLFGPNILVCALSSHHPINKIYFPAGAWYNLYNDTFHEGGQELLMETPKEKLPVFVKAGGMLTMQTAIAHTGEKPEPVLQLHLYQGSTGSSFGYYEDEGDTYDFEQGVYYKREIRFEPENQQLVFEAVEGSFESKFKEVRVYFHGFDAESLKVTRNGQAMELQKEDYRFLEQISNFDPVQKIDLDETIIIRNLPQAQLSLDKEAFVVKLS